uniref:glucuronosyltransferase n=1 Tax=Caenorhabditis japonica TaxID=281687 RepID=A0A8R1E937_CAEJA
MHLLRRLSIFLLALDSSSLALNVLVYSPVFGGSHSNFMGNIADSLTEVGHNVTFLVPVADVTRKNDIGVKLTKNVIIVDENAQPVDDSNMDEVLKPLWTIQNRPSDFATCFEFFIEMMKTSCEEFTSNQKVFEELSKTKFDVAIAEPITVCGLGYFAALGINKTILASSVTQYEGVVRNSGEPLDMSYVPVHGAYFDEKMSIWDRYTNWGAESVMAGNLEMMFDEEMKKYRKNLGDHIAHWRDLIPAASLFFTNSNPYLDFPRPVIQKTVPIGGISVNMEKIKSTKLDHEWDEILNKREHNMLISFGSMVKSTTMPENWR